MKSKKRAPKTPRVLWIVLDEDGHPTGGSRVKSESRRLVRKGRHERLVAFVPREMQLARRAKKGT